MAIVIRTRYNNHGWKSPCKEPGRDENCWLCFKQPRGSEAPSKEGAICAVNCWEQHLCTRFEWGCTPEGKVWGDEIQPGDRAFLVYKEKAGNYALWGLSNVFSAKRQVATSGEDGHRGFAFLHLDDFTPIPLEKRPRGLTPEEILGGPWGRGDYKVISLSHAEHLEDLVEQLSGSR